MPQRFFESSGLVFIIFPQQTTSGSRGELEGQACCRNGFYQWVVLDVLCMFVSRLCSCDDEIPLSILSTSA